MSAPDSETLDRMLAEATPGPWKRGVRYRSIVAEGDTGYDDPQHVHAYGGHLLCESVARDGNLDLIAAAPDTTRDLIDTRALLSDAMKHVAERDAEIARLRGDLEKYHELFVFWRNEADQRAAERDEDLNREAS